ncbi:hypothetical protein FA95DRAFT_1567704 [Auriscalpium vulgare]|uniref:Uncharacterized protein n=1 Tax=Auriscalpium vulgare TaxID=40419 RepID=A0ACB8R3M3_9AGAM|nr:hypothetical protein FA95DRAFT_1567704 [Auriscalpium vulgare]
MTSSNTLPRKTFILPVTGAYVALTFDPAATLEALEDPIATAQAKALVTKKYVGFISQCLELPLPERRYHECQCRLLTQGLPNASLSEHIDETMCATIAPAQHPTGRPALKPSPPLPWDNLYHDTLRDFYLRVTTQAREIDHAQSPMLPVDDMLALIDYCSADRRRRAGLQPPPADTPAPTHWQPRAPPAVAHDGGSISILSLGDEENADVDEDLLSDSGCSSSFVSSESGESDLIDIPRALADPFVIKEDPRRRFMPVVKFDVDLSTITEFAGAELLLEEIAAVDRIRAESEERSRQLVADLERARVEKDHPDASPKSPSESTNATGSKTPRALAGIRALTRRRPVREQQDHSEKTTDRSRPAPTKFSTSPLRRLSRFMRAMLCV